MGGLVYFSTFGARTYAVDARNGRERWRFPDGRYTPLVADEERVYIVGHKKLYALEPRS
jgi:outer membrane protein assembly factor BamB